METAPKPARFLLVIRWLVLAIAAGWACVSFFLPGGEGRWSARLVFLVPLVLPLVIVEYLYLRSKERAALAVAAAKLGLQPKGKLLGQRLVGQYRGYEVDFATEADNALGKGTCLELRAPGLEGLAVGSRSSSRVLRRAAGKEAKKLELGQKDLEAWSADPSWQAVLSEPGVVAALLAFAGGGDPARLGAVLGPKVLRALYGRHQSFVEVKAFLDEAADVADRLLQARKPSA